MTLREAMPFRKGPLRAQGRRARIFPLAILNFLLGLGSLAGFFSSQSALISRFGASHLFHVYLGQGLLTLLLSSLFYLLADRLPRRRFVSAWFVFLGCLVAGSWIALRAATEAWVFVAARSLFDAVSISGSLAYWLSVGDHFSTQGAKRHYSFLMGAFLLGDMAGGFLIQETAAVFHSLNFLPLWAGILFFAPCCLAKFSNLPIRGGRPVSPPREPEGGSAAFSSTRALLRLSSLLFLFWLAYSFFSDATDFLFNRYAQGRLGSEDQLTAYFGSVALGANAVIFLYHACCSQAALRRFGLNLAVVAIPCLIAGVWLLAHAHPDLWTLALAQGLIYFFIEYLAVTRLHLPLTLIRRAWRGRVKAATEGVGRACGFLVLFGIAGAYSFRPNFEELSRIILAGALLFLAFPLLFFRLYRPAPVATTRPARAIDPATALHALARRRWANLRRGFQPILAELTLRFPFSFHHPARPPP